METFSAIIYKLGINPVVINGPMLKASGLKVGNVASIEIEFDPRPREEPMPPRLRAEFRKNTSAAKAFNLLPPSRRKEILRYINSLKSVDSIESNVARVISQLSGGADDERPAFMRKR